MKKLVIIISLAVFLLITTGAETVSASNNLKIDCDNRYLTLVNPVRGRGLWFDQSLDPIDSQYSLVSKYKLPATWLLQYDVLKDQELMEKIQSMNESQEGIKILNEAMAPKSAAAK